MLALAHNLGNLIESWKSMIELTKEDDSQKNILIYYKIKYKTKTKAREKKNSKVN